MTLRYSAFPLAYNGTNVQTFPTPQMFVTRPVAILPQTEYVMGGEGGDIIGGEGGDEVGSQVLN